MAWATLLLMLLIAGALLVLLTAAVMAWAMLHPPRMTDGKAAWVLRRLSPGDLGLRFQEVSFTVRDEKTGRELRLAGWWIAGEHASGRCVIMVHGYADAKVGAIAWAPVFHRIGCNVLALDMRAHGESEGTICTAGHFEQHDLNQVIDRVRVERPEQTRQLVLFGISMGAGICTLAARHRADLAGVILECPSPDFAHAIRAHVNLLGLPGGIVHELSLRMAGWMAGVNFRALNQLNDIRELRTGLMIIQSGADPLVPPADMQSIQSAARQRESLPYPTVYWRMEDAGHLMAICSDAEEYERRVSEFLSAAWSPREPAPNPSTE